MLYALSGVPREAFSQFPMRRKTAVFGPTFDGEGVVRSDDITKDPCCRAVRDIVEGPLTLPDGRTLHLYAVHFPSGGNPIECREQAMRALNGLSAALPTDAMAVAGGGFNFPATSRRAICSGACCQRIDGTCPRRSGQDATSPGLTSSAMRAQATAPSSLVLFWTSSLFPTAS